MAKVKYLRIFLIMAVCGLLIFLHWLGILAPVESVLARALNPVFSGFYNLGVYAGSFYRHRLDQEDWAGKAAVLTAQVNQLTEENIKLKLMAEENEILRQHLDFLTAGQHNYVMANVISRGNPSAISEITTNLVIDKGERDGLYAGLAVLSSEGIIVGRIASVKEAIAHVYLTNNRECRLAATIIDGSKTSGITEGDLGLTVKMSFIPQEIMVKAGDIAVTSGLELTIPRGLAIGRVISVNKESNDLWQNATLEPLVDPSTLTIVSVVKP
ncbi:MAG: rod shape-determining protein MreC [Planctomycetes bacterium]|nr:rod shape-determining protein MreC [Planctomycetota bacterium]